MKYHHETQRFFRTNTHTYTHITSVPQFKPMYTLRRMCCQFCYLLYVWDEKLYFNSAVRFNVRNATVKRGDVQRLSKARDYKTTLVDDKVQSLTAEFTIPGRNQGAGRNPGDAQIQTGYPFQVARRLRQCYFCERTLWRRPTNICSSWRKETFMPHVTRESAFKVYYIYFVYGINSTMNFIQIAPIFLLSPLRVGRLII